MSSTLSSILSDVVSSLDLPQPLVEDAVEAYREVASWLGAPASPLLKYDPQLYPQGSFRLGTPIRPRTPGAEFDIDLVCRLAIPRASITQGGLKDLVGKRLRAHEEHGPNLLERRRCWTIPFETRFHLDVLPSIPDDERRGNHILLTDTELTRWQHSNPIGYADWFYERMKVLLREAREALAKARNAAVDDVPEWSVRTPLQRTVQFLKRHRDVKYNGPKEHTPVSIIITTLAAKAYQQERELDEAISRTVERMPNFIERREGRWWVPNPAHPEENFADKWNEEPSRRDAFLRWMDALSADIATIGRARSVTEAQNLAKSVLDAGNARESLLLETSVPIIDSLAHLQTPPWPIAIRYGCSVEARVHRDTHGKFLWKMASRLLPKRLGLRFLASTDAPEPFIIKWQVSNSGDEARRANQLRGGFEDGTGQSGVEKWESTKYRGTHMVEAFVVKNGVVVARSGRVNVRIV